MTAVRIDPGPEGDWCFLTLSRAGSKNAIDPQTISDLRDSVTGVGEATRLVVLRGEGNGSFIAGADIASMLAMNRAEASVFVAAGHRFTRALEQHSAVIGALVDGYALGGGSEIVLACDVVVATRRAVFGFPEVRLGIFPGWGGTQRLARTAPYQEIMGHLLTGRRFGPDEAYRLGMVTAVVETTADATKWFADLMTDLRRASPRAVAAAKRAARAGAGLTLDEALAAEADLWLTQFETPDRTEGMRAFLEKRAANWARS